MHSTVNGFVRTLSGADHAAEGVPVMSGLRHPGNKRAPNCSEDDTQSFQTLIERIRLPKPEYKESEFLIFGSRALKGTISHFRDGAETPITRTNLAAAIESIRNVTVKGDLHKEGAPASAILLVDKHNRPAYDLQNASVRRSAVITIADHVSDLLTPSENNQLAQTLELRNNHEYAEIIAEQAAGACLHIEIGSEAKSVNICAIANVVRDVARALYPNRYVTVVDAGKKDYLGFVPPSQVLPGHEGACVYIESSTDAMPIFGNGVPRYHTNIVDQLSPTVDLPLRRSMFRSLFKLMGNVLSAPSSMIGGVRKTAPSLDNPVRFIMHVKNRDEQQTRVAFLPPAPVTVRAPSLAQPLFFGL